MRMTYGIICVFFFLLLAYPGSITAQDIYVDPALLSLQQNGDPTIFLHADPVLLGVSLNYWAVSCTAEPLLHDSSPSSIPTEQLYLKHDLIEDYQPFTSAMDLGNGYSEIVPTIINHLFFQLRLTGSEEAGHYSGIIHFFNNGIEAAQLILQLYIEKSLEFEITPFGIACTPSLPGIYVADSPVELVVSNSNTTDWHVEIDLLSSSSYENFSGSNIAVRSSLSEDIDDGFGPGFEIIDDHPYIISGDRVGRDGTAQVEFKTRTSWSTNPGNYHLIFDFRIPELNISRQLHFYIDVIEYSTFSLSETALYFHANGPPQIWDGDVSPLLNVGTNCSYWGVTCEATPLISPDDEIPNSRMFIKITPDDFTGDDGGGLGYHKMDVLIVVAEGVALPPQQVAQMWFRLQTLDVDRPGRYQGTITFTFLTDP